MDGQAAGKNRRNSRKMQKEVENIIKQEGEHATFEIGVHGLHPELSTLGRLIPHKLRSECIEAFNRGFALAGIMAGELGGDNSCKRAGLLHDIGKAVDHETEGSHITIGADIARKYKKRRSNTCNNGSSR